MFSQKETSSTVPIYILLELIENIEIIRAEFGMQTFFTHAKNSTRY